MFKLWDISNPRIIKFSGSHLVWGKSIVLGSVWLSTKPHFAQYAYNLSSMLVDIYANTTASNGRPLIICYSYKCYAISLEHINLVQI